MHRRVHITSQGQKPDLGKKGYRIMKRRTFLKAAAGAAVASAGGLAAPSLALAADTKVLKFVPQANLANLDPIWTTLYVVRNASVLFWDTLYGVDSKLVPQPQMVEGHELSSDGLTWTFKLRPGLKFHDNTPVLTKDVVASLKRWMVRDGMGQVLSARLNEMKAVDDRTFTISLKKPFPKMLYALGKVGTPVAFIMPERIANTDPFKPISEYVGSGPFVFKVDEWVPGSQAVFQKFGGYVPRSEKADWLAGGKVVHFDRVEWKVIPDAATASAALQNGEVDWWETPIPDVVPLLKRSGGLRVDISDPLGNIGDFRMNHLYPPFNDERVRRAVLMAANQTDYLQAMVGDDKNLWTPLPSYFTPGTPFSTTAGGEILEGKRDYAAATKLIEEAGQKGAKVVLLVPQDVAIAKAEGDITADMLKKIGFDVDYQAIDWGTMGARRAKKDPPDKGGWNAFFTWHAGADCVNPAANIGIVTSGDKAWFGWPKNDAIQAKIDAWYDAPTPDAEKALIVDINRMSMQFGTYVPTGFFKGYQAWSDKLSGVIQAPFPVVWGVTKS